MVQKYQSPVRVYKYPFELVMAAYEKRFPTCKMIPVFLGSDILSEYKSEDGAVYIIERRCKLNVEAPYLLKKIIGVEFVYFIQKNTLDRRERSLKIEAFNESFSSRVVINENCTYSVHPENPDWTCFEQTASLDVKSFLGFENAIEKLAMKQYSHNIKKGKEIIEYYINELISEGITYIPRFEDKPALPKIHVTENINSSNKSDLNNRRGSITHQSSIIQEGHQLSDVNLKLESEYIERCLGELTPFQESCLVQLKKWMAEAHQGKVPSDQTLVRFLQAQDYSLEKAREMLCHSLVWRKKYQVDRILSTYNSPKVVKEYFPGGWHHFDIDGRPLYILRLGQMDVKGFIKSIGEEGLVKLTLHVCEEGLRRAEEATRLGGKPVRKTSLKSFGERHISWTCLLDLEGLNMRHLWRPGVKALLHIIEIVEANYPETMGRVLIVRAPRVFPILWTLVSTFINDNTRSKFVFYGGNDYQGAGGLLEFVDKSVIPDFLGGECQTTIPEGGLVPKTYYMSDEEYEREKAEGHHLFDDSMYHSVSMAKGQVHEKIIKINDRGSVICWDFDVMKEDVRFTVLYTRQPLPPPEAQICDEEVQGCAHAALPLAMLNLDSPPFHSAIPKNWVQDQDYIVVEPTLTCHDGESVQGSHVTRFEGSYILQWRHGETLHHYSFDFPLSSHKAKVMYYYEVLKSQDYKGSMSSLQSSHSGATCTSSGEHSAPSSCPSR
ncbi:SEC14-like protein 1 isoform X1 [Centruroides vittatus]|uniref:SEC14-like protein 1 isoform X1 n=1 Tax=Centruroides vittatus TaxID=120091 RepID=UPI00350FAC5F